MASFAIRAEALGKRFAIGSGSSYGTLRDAVAGAFRRAGGRSHGTEATNRAPNEVWALRDVSFEIAKGDVVGIVGRNGAGKSTLLKVLSRITRPTVGRAEVVGRVGCLLEVGTGFHPELTGRENIVLNGAILGMSRREVSARFDEITAFAGVERFLDTPVKRYSSGMYLRLAFSVAAHLESDILIVDEVLAVGDASFQERCLGKMRSLSSDGRTVFFVSHNLNAVTRLCTRALLLEEGRLTFAGTAAEVVSHYQEGISDVVAGDLETKSLKRRGTGKVRIASVEILPLDDQGNPQKIFETGFSLRFSMVLQAKVAVSETCVAVEMFDERGFRVIHANSGFIGQRFELEAGQERKVDLTLLGLRLAPGTYRSHFWVGRGREHFDYLEDAGKFFVAPSEERRRHVAVGEPAAYDCLFSCG
jgi:lipopolysaccharide transport system ATP-binding protein